MEIKSIEETLKHVDLEKVEHLNKVKKMVEYIKEGLSEFDAMLLVGYNEITFEEMKEEYPKVSTEIDRAKIEYKRTLLRTLSKAGADGDERISQWLLEKQFGEEFNQKARQPSSENTQTDLLVSAIREIQGSTTTTLIGIKAQTRRLLNDNDVPHK